MSEGTRLAAGSEWTFDNLAEYESAIAEVAKRYRLDTYPIQIEIINSAEYTATA